MELIDIQWIRLCKRLYPVGPSLFSVKNTGLCKLNISDHFVSEEFVNN